jgi:hypothetical protein
MNPAHHDAPALDPVHCSIVARWPVGTFIENILVLPDGDVLVSVENKQELQRVRPDGSASVFARLPVGPAGIVAHEDAFFVAGGEPGRAAGSIFLVGSDGSVETWIPIAESRFLNGFTPLRPGRALVVDSIKGLIIDVDLNEPDYAVWLQHELFTKISDEPMLPGVNGIKVYDGAVYVTNTDRALVIRVPIQPDGTAGEPFVVAEHLRGDDLAFDRDGNCYITTHIHNSLVRLTPHGDRVALAGADEGMAGCTACAFGRTDRDAESLYVTTTGGLIMPLGGVVQEAKLVRLDIGKPGYPITLSA